MTKHKWSYQGIIIHSSLKVTLVDHFMSNTRIIVCSQYCVWRNVFHVYFSLLAARSAPASPRWKHLTTSSLTCPRYDTFWTLYHLEPKLFITDLVMWIWITRKDWWEIVHNTNTMPLWCRKYWIEQQRCHKCSLFVLGMKVGHKG